MGGGKKSLPGDLLRCSPNPKKKKPMSRFQKLSHVLWYCQYHIVFVPKCRHQVLKDDRSEFIYKSIYAHSLLPGSPDQQLSDRSGAVPSSFPDDKGLVFLMISSDSPWSIYVSIMRIFYID